MSDRQKCLLFVFVCLGVLGLASCAGSSSLSPTSPPLTPSVISLPGRSNTYTGDDLNQACEDILAIDGEEVYRVSPATKPLLWTLGVNFDLMSPERNPVGCFKLYARQEPFGSQPGTYAPIPNALLLVNTCTLIDEVDLRSGVVTFNGGYIKCEVDLTNWVQQLGLRIDPSWEPLLRGFYTDENAREHLYPNFTIVANASVSAITTSPVTLPIVFYHPPTPDNSATPTYIPPELSLNLENGSGAWKWGNCTVTLESSHYWWDDLKATLTPNAQYSYSEASTPVATHCGNRSGTAPLRFSIEPGNLYIGYNPLTGERFQGKMDGILIDPTDSKPVVTLTPTP